MEKCINNYKKAKENIQEPHNAEYCSYSTLQYFEKYIYINEDATSQVTSFSMNKINLNFLLCELK